MTLTTDAGATFTDMTEDNQSSVYPGALHPDHHALVVNPLNWQQFFDLSDGGVNRSDGVFVNDSGDCTAPPHSFAVPSRIAFCQLMLSRVPEQPGCDQPRPAHACDVHGRLLTATTGPALRRHPGQRLVGDVGGPTWLEINIADGGPNRFDATGADENFAVTAFQSGQLEVRYNPMQQYDVNWIADTLTDPSSCRTTRPSSPRSSCPR